MVNTAAKKITYDGNPVQVESAIRDGSGKEISSTYAPKFTVETTGSGNAVTAVSYASNKITATKGTAFSTSDTKNTAGSTNSASKLFLIGATSQAANPQTYSNSKVYETDGALVATTIDATQVGGMTKTYTTGANTTRVILARVNNYTGLASCRIKLEIGPDTSSGAKVAYLDAVWAGRSARLVIESVYDWNNAVRYFFITCPNNTSYYTSYPPEIHIQQTTAVARTIKATIIEKSGDVVLMDNLTTTGVTTNRNSYTYDVNNTVGLYDNAGYINTSGWSNGTWDRIDNDRYRISATKVFVNGSTNRGVRGGKLSGMGSDGYLHHIATPEMTFQLPFVGGRSNGDFDINSTWGRVSYAIRGIGTTEFTNLLVCNTAALTAGSTYTGTGTCYATQYRFNVPGETEVTTLTAGKNVYVVGNLDSNGNFKPYYTTQTGQTIAVPKGQGGFTANTNCVMYKYTFYLTQTPAYNANYNTFLFIGRSDQSTTQFSYMTYNPIAYTLNSGGKLTHIDGKPIQDTTYSITDSSSASAISTGTNLTTERDVYYGLPTINNAHNYTSSTKIYAPTGGGTSGQILKANGSTSTPTWVNQSSITSGACSGNSATATRMQYAQTISNRTLTLVSSSDTDVSGYPYKYSFAVTGATTNHCPTVAFSMTELGYNVWAPIASTGSNVVYIYAKSQQSTLTNREIGYVLN